MAASSANRRPLQFSLKTMFVVLFVCAVVLSVLRWFGLEFLLRALEKSCTYSRSSWIIVPAAFACLCAAITWAARRRAEPRKPRGHMSRTIAIVLAVTGAAAGYVAWAHHRLDWHIADAGFPRAWPYPDRAIIILNDWYDVRYPVSPGFIKIHGELPRVRFTFHVALFVFSSICGWCLGFVVPPFRRGRRQSLNSE